jgi:hypothetical protein
MGRKTILASAILFSVAASAQQGGSAQTIKPDDEVLRVSRDGAGPSHLLWITASDDGGGIWSG